MNIKKEKPSKLSTKLFKIFINHEFVNLIFWGILTFMVLSRIDQLSLDKMFSIFLMAYLMSTFLNSHRSWRRRIRYL